MKITVAKTTHRKMHAIVQATGREVGRPYASGGLSPQDLKLAIRDGVATIRRLKQLRPPAAP